VGASTAVVSSGPFKYQSVTLPDQEVLLELEGRGAVFRTDLDEAACRDSAAKIGSDADGKAGGCDNVRLTVQAGLPVVAEYFRGVD
jgi:hypothetical protein